MNIMVNDREFYMLMYYDRAQELGLVYRPATTYHEQYIAPAAIGLETKWINFERDLTEKIFADLEFVKNEFLSDAKDIYGCKVRQLDHPLGAEITDEL